MSARAENHVLENQPAGESAARTSEWLGTMAPEISGRLSRRIAPEQVNHPSCPLF
jgi:hypothetical protein